MSTVEPCYRQAKRRAIAARPPAAAMDRIQEKLALVIPTLREAESIGRLLDRVRATFAATNINYEILVVDDDSQDGTEELVSAFARQDPRVRLFIRKQERGLSGAILYGWQQTDASILGAMDADFQHPPEVLPSLLTAIADGHDLAIASRYANGGRIGGWSPLRRLVSMAAVCLTSPLQKARHRAKDPLSGFFLVRRRCLPNAMFQSQGFKLLLEILVRGQIRSVQEVPFAFGPRRTGYSKAGLKVAWEFLRLLLKLYGTRWSGTPVAEQAAGD